MAIRAENSISPQQRKLLNIAVECGALQFGRFILKSGRISPFFFNAGSFRDGRCLHAVADAYAELIFTSRVKYDVIFGPAYKGIPLASATSVVLASRFGEAAPFIYDRKEAKDHGEGGFLVGSVEALKSVPNSENKPKVLFLDDVLTSGTALEEGLSKIKAYAPAAEVAAVVILLDRQEVYKDSGMTSADMVSKQYNTKVLSILNMQTLLIFLEELIEKETNEGKRQELIKSLEDLRVYRQQYGCSKDRSTP